MQELTTEEFDAWVLAQKDCWDEERRVFRIDQLAKAAMRDGIQVSMFDIGIAAHFAKHKMRNKDRDE